MHHPSIDTYHYLQKQLGVGGFYLNSAPMVSAKLGSMHEKCLSMLQRSATVEARVLMLFDNLPVQGSLQAFFPS